MKKLLFLVFSFPLFSMEKEFSYSKKESDRFLQAVQQFLKKRHQELVKINEQRKHEHEKILKHITKSDITIDDEIFELNAFLIDIQIKTVLTKEGFQKQKTSNILPNPEFEKNYQTLLGLPKSEKHSNSDLGLFHEFMEEHLKYFNSSEQHRDNIRLYTKFLEELAQTYCMGYNSSIKDEYMLGLDLESAKVERAFKACLPNVKLIFKGALQRLLKNDGKFCLKLPINDETSSSGSANSTPLNSPRLQEDLTVTRERAYSIDHSLVKKKKNLVRSRSRSFSGK